MLSCPGAAAPQEGSDVIPLACNATAAGSVTVRNTGAATWTREAGYSLGAVDDSDPLHDGDPRVWLPDDASVPPDGTWTFDVALTAPGEAGTYTTDWQMVHEAVAWFGEITSADVIVECDPVVTRTGLVTLSGSSLLDDQGAFNALGTTLMWAAWGMRHDTERLADNLAFLSSHGFHYIRALGVVGDYDEPDYWDGREIDWRWADYAQVLALTQYMRDRTDILVAASAPAGQECADALELYAGDVADLATIHFDRRTDLADGAWRPVRQPWEHLYCEGLPVGSNNEPIGPGASVNTEEDPVKLVAAAIATYVSNLPLYVFHTGAGVRGDDDLWEMSGADAFVHVDAIVPGDLASWSRRNAHWADSPFLVYAEDSGGGLHPDQMWPDLGEPAAGVVRAYGDVSGDDFFVFPMGILDHVLIEARRAMTFDVIDPMTGAVLETVTLDAGQQHTLSGHAALVLSGSFL